jgi:hypothetical protein
MLFARFAFFTVSRDAGVVALAAALLMLAFSYDPAMAFAVGATAVLAFSLGLLLRALCLTERRFARSEAWSALTEDERPLGIDGMLWARAELERMLLGFAKSAAAVACVLYGSALVLAAA